MQNTLDRVAVYLENLNVKLLCELSPKATQDDLNTAQEQAGLALPESYITFLTQFANGLELSWVCEGAFSTTADVAPVESSIGGMLGMRDWRLYDDDAAREYGFPYVDDPEQALETNRLMHNWIPFHAVGNGSNFSINLNNDGFGHVIFDQHDWLDGGTGYNGFMMSSDLPSFFESWASVCFSQPQSLDWKSVIDDDGVKWDSSEFDDRLRLPN